MANHTIDCGICGDDLRGSGQQRCKWNGCPGWNIGLREDLDNICQNHPDENLRNKAIQCREEERKRLGR